MPLSSWMKLMRVPYKRKFCVSCCETYHESKSCHNNENCQAVPSWQQRKHDNNSNNVCYLCQIGRTRQIGRTEQFGYTSCQILGDDRQGRIDFLKCVKSQSENLPLRMHPSPLVISFESTVYHGPNNGQTLVLQQRSLGLRLEQHRISEKQCDEWQHWKFGKSPFLNGWLGTSSKKSEWIAQFLYG